jgi:hypothetical protein
MSFSSKVGARRFLAGARGGGLEGGFLAVAWLGHWAYAVGASGSALY